ncbi:MAG: hypothetical protein ACPG8W_07705 [Candidatus Promineifilaceae bacterium]
MAKTTSAETSPPPPPAPLGWGSQSLKAVECETEKQVEKAALAVSVVVLPSEPVPTPEPQNSDPAPVEEPNSFTVFPSIAINAIKCNQVAVARVWWILRTLDRSGSGAFSAENARAQLTEKTSKWHTFGWRQLRKLLHAGQDTFWKWDGRMIWLRSRVKVAAALEMERFQGAEVELSADILTKPLTQLKAELYATFHQSRPTTPIARATLTDLVGISDSSQRRYERAANIQTQKQVALATTKDYQEAAWQYGYAGFKLVDHRGVHGEKGRTYFARQIPNLFRPKSPLNLSSKRKVRQLNRRLKDLLKLGTTGNEKCRPTRLYFAEGTKLKGSKGLYQSENENIWYSMEPIETKGGSRSLNL